MANKWKERYLKEVQERFELSQNITNLFEKHLAEIENKYKKSKYKSFENALRLKKVAKKDMKIYKIIVEFWRLAVHSTFKKL